MTTTLPPRSETPEDAPGDFTSVANQHRSGEIFLRSRERLAETPIRPGAELVYGENYISLRLAIVHAVKTDGWGFHVTLRDGHAPADTAARDVWTIKAPWGNYSFRVDQLQLGRCHLYFSARHVEAVKEVERMYPDASGMERFARMEDAYWLRLTGYPLPRED
jgi:hypothetical protein